LLGVCSSAGRLTFGVVATIVSYFPEYVHVARAARVSKQWFCAVNMDKWRETPMLACKRHWIAREFYLHKHFATVPNMTTGKGSYRAPRYCSSLMQFRHLLEYAQLANEWQEHHEELLLNSSTGGAARKGEAQVGEGEGSLSSQWQLRMLTRLLLSPHNLRAFGIRAFKSTGPISTTSSSHLEADLERASNTVYTAVWANGSKVLNDKRNLALTHEELYIVFDGVQRRGGATYRSAGVVVEINGQNVESGLSIIPVSSDDTTRCKCCVM
jgi:hypothetical protein